MITEENNEIKGTDGSHNAVHDIPSFGVYQIW